MLSGTEPLSMAVTSIAILPSGLQTLSGNIGLFPKARDQAGGCAPPPNPTTQDATVPPRSDGRVLLREDAELRGVGRLGVPEHGRLVVVEKDHVRFQPANKAMAPIYVRAVDFRPTMLLGVVVSVFRRL